MMRAALVLALSAAPSSADWPRFRGPNGSGLGEGPPPPVEFSPGRGVVWKATLPPGLSSPVLAGDRVFVTGAEAQSLVTIALDRATGAVVWRRELPRARSLPVDRRNHPASPTPASDGENVYVFFQDFGLVSYDRAGGERWRFPLGPFDNAYGMGASPIVADGLLVLACDQGNGSFLLALGKDDGRQRWRVERPEARSGHSTPIVHRPQGGPAQLLLPGSFLLTAYVLQTGEKLWWVRGLAFEMKATPVIRGGSVFVHGTVSATFEDSYGGAVPGFEQLRAHDVDGDGRFSREEVPDTLAARWMKLLDLDGDGFLGPAEWAYFQAARSSAGGLWAFRLGGRGDMTAASALWHYDRSVPQLPSPLIAGDLLYMVADGGILTALDPETGRALSRTRLEGAVDSYYASPVAAGGRLLVVSEAGRAVVLAGGARPRVLAVNDLEDAVYATPALADGRIYLRTRGALYCFGADAPAAGPR